jgi:meso-butanediol dehydrogenase/(S,S)-butanediol dehydrogenase/diacetyl reductase
MRRFEDRVVLITGASSGIGRATAERLAEEGARLFLVDVAAQALEETAKRTRELGAETEISHCDVSDAAAVDAAVGNAAQRFGSLHVLCNVAGILQFGHTHEFPRSDWSRVLSVNLDGVFFACQAAIPHLLETRGNIVNMASTAALAGSPWAAAYAASKGGVLALTRCLAIEYGKQGLRANAVCPGSITTPMTGKFHFPDGADRKLVYRMMPLDEFRGPETVASTVAFLASDDAAHINGVALRVDGATLS